MTLACNECGKKTDALKLKHFNGRDWLLCKLCGTGRSNESPNSQRPLLGIQDEDGEFIGHVQPRQNFISDRQFPKAGEASMASGDAGEDMGNDSDEA